MNDLRLHPRVPSQLTAEVTNQADDSQTVKILNLSPGGLMLLGDQQFKALIFKDHCPDKDPLFHPVEVEVRIDLPEQNSCFYSRLRLLYVRRLSQHEYNLGFRYVAISEIHSRMMERHVFADSDTKNALNQAFGSL